MAKILFSILQSRVFVEQKAKHLKSEKICVCSFRFTIEIEIYKFYNNIGMQFANGKQNAKLRSCSQKCRTKHFGNRSENNIFDKRFENNSFNKSAENNFSAKTKLFGQRKQRFPNEICARRQIYKMKDVIIIGGGVIGCSIARELARYNAEILVLEKGNDVSVGTTKANSGIVHAGHDAVPGSKKAHYNVLGNAMFDRLSAELEFPFRRNGSLVLCFDESKKEGLTELLNRGIKNGVKGLYILEGNEEIRKMEPYVSEQAVAALVVPSGGIVSPYEMAIAYAENAAENGVNFEFLSEVTSIDRHDFGFVVKCANGNEHQAKVVINCAGVYADVINNMVCEEKIRIIPRKGDYVLMDKTCGYLADHTLFQLPTKMGKGVLVTPTTHGNILVGPSATDVDDKDDVNTTAEELNESFEKALITVPTLARRNIITQFSGLRAHSESGDFIVGESSVENFFNVAGIESPGLTAAPAIAVDIAALVAEKLQLKEKLHFEAHRKAIPHFATMSDADREKLIEQNPLYGKIVCRCEVVTEGEIVESIRRPVGAKDLDGVKRRVRAGMGRCQAGFCTARTMEILARELGCDMQEITKRGGNSEIVVGKTK